MGGDGFDRHCVVGTAVTDGAEIAHFDATFFLRFVAGARNPAAKNGITYFSARSGSEMPKFGPLPACMRERGLTLGIQ
jgi:hypothetical protein